MTLVYSSFAINLQEMQVREEAFVSAQDRNITLFNTR
jgi:hypothetical protein